MHHLVAVLFVAAVVAVNCQDPTAICLPSVYTNYYFNMLSQDKGHVFANFTKEKYAEVSSVTGTRIVYDFANLMSYVITGEANNKTCQSFKLTASQILHRCLPAYSKVVLDASGVLDSSTKMPVQTWDIPTEYGTFLRIVFVNAASPFVPLLLQQYGYFGTTQFVVYMNHTDSISDPSVLEIPASCSQQATIVG